MTTKIIGEILKEMGIIAQEQIDAALHVQKATDEPLGEVLVKLNFITTDELAHVIAFQHTLEYVDSESYVPSRETLELIDKDLAVTGMVLPLKVHD